MFDWGRWIRDVDHRLSHIGATLETVRRQGVKIMSDTSGLTQSLADLKEEIGQIGTQMDANFQALIAAQGAGDQAAIDAAKAAIDADVAALKEIGTRDTFPPPTV